MAVPSGVSVCNVYLNAPISFIGEAGRVHLEIRPSASLTFVDEEGVGHPLGNFISTLDPENGTAASIILPHVDQDGFLDSAGNGYTGWYYTASISYEYEGQLINLPDRDFQVVVGQDFADLSQIVWGLAEPAMVAPIPTVTSVEGMTGVVTLQGLGLDLVDNTPDSTKPVSGPQQTALDKKLDKYVDDAGTFADRGAVQTISRNLANPTNLQPTVWINVSGKGDNATFKGVVAGQFLARDRTDVTIANKGVLYALQAVVAPAFDRNNVPFDDVVGLSIVNQGTGIGTDGIYFGKNRADRVANPAGKDFSNLIQIDSNSDSVLRSIATHDIGIGFGGATFTTSAIRLPNASSISWNDSAGVLVHALRLSAGGTLRLLEGGLDIRSDKSVYANNKMVLANGSALRGIKNGVTTEADLIKLTSTDSVSIASDAIQVFTTGEVALKNNKPIQIQNAAASAYVEALKLTASDNLSLLGAKAVVLSSGALLLAEAASVPAAPTAAASLYVSGGLLKYKDPSGVVHNPSDVYASPDGTKWRVTVGNDGALTTTAL